MPLPEMSARVRARRPSLEDEEVVVVAADGVSGTTIPGEVYAINFGIALRKEALLDLAGDLDLAGEAFALGDFGGEALEEFGVLEGESGLRGNGLEELAVGFSVGLFGTLGAQGDDAGEAIAAGKRYQEFG